MRGVDGRCHVGVGFADLGQRNVSLLEGRDETNGWRNATREMECRRTMERRELRYSRYRSEGRLAGVMFPAPPWIMRRGLILGSGVALALQSIFFLRGGYSLRV